jgi:hypothetical protein
MNALISYYDGLPHHLKEPAFLVRETILSVNPEAIEVLRHGVPFFDFKGMWIYLTRIKGKKNSKDYLHIGFNDGNFMTPHVALEKGNRMVVQVYRIPDLLSEDHLIELETLLKDAVRVRNLKRKNKNHQA